MVSRAVNSGLVESSKKKSRTAGNAEECRRNFKKMSRICATPHLGEELLEKMGNFVKTPEKKVEAPRKKENRKKGEP